MDATQAISNMLMILVLNPFQPRWSDEVEQVSPDINQ